MTKLRYQVIAIFGPTASGKSDVAQVLAARLDTEVVSADALQVYRELPILTNQSPWPTRLVAIRNVTETMSVGEYALLAHAAIDELVASSGAAVVTGGTGLYLRAAIADLRIPGASDPAQRAEIERRYDADPPGAYELLQAVDPAAAAAIHANDRKRVVRALELAHAGDSLSPADDRLWSAATRRPTIVVGLDVPPDELERRIQARTDDMLARGAVEEARAAFEAPASRTADKALGLRELASLPLETARECIVERTRRYAAYQRKWMRRIPDIVMVDGDREPEQVADAILDLASTR
jgi:tRNA dimethylallyltransferase